MALSAEAQARQAAVAEEKEAGLKRAAKKAHLKQAEIALSGLDGEQRDHLATYLLKQSKARQLSVLEMVLETWAETLTDPDLKWSSRQKKKVDYTRRLAWVRDYFGTRFEREGQPRFRKAKLSTVIAALVKFCLSAGDRDKSEEADLGLFTLTADKKTAEALLALSAEDEGVTITQEGYNQAQKLLRMMEEAFGDKLIDGAQVKHLVEDVRGLLKTSGVPEGRFTPPIKGGK